MKWCLFKRIGGKLMGANKVTDLFIPRLFRHVPPPSRRLP